MARTCRKPSIHIGYPKISKHLFRSITVNAFWRLWCVGLFGIVASSASALEQYCIDYPLHCAARDARHETIEYLISVGHKIDTTDREGKTPLALTIIKGDLLTSQLLVKNGAHLAPWPYYSEPAIFYTLDRSTEHVDLVLKLGANINALNRNSLPAVTYCILNNALCTNLEYLLQKGASPNTKTGRPATPPLETQQSRYL